MICVFLADGFEEIEAVSVIDILRRAEMDVKTVGVGSKLLTGSHGITIAADIEEKDLNLEEITMVVLPGGMPGTLNLENSNVVKETIGFCMKSNLIVGAICAAPSILGHLGYLNGRTATCFPGFENDLRGAIKSDFCVCRDGNIITANGAGSALDFGLELVAADSPRKAKNIRQAMRCP